MIILLFHHAWFKVSENTKKYYSSHAKYQRGSWSTKTWYLSGRHEHNRLRRESVTAPRPCLFLAFNVLSNTKLLVPLTINLDLLKSGIPVLEESAKSLSAWSRKTFSDLTSWEGLTLSSMVSLLSQTVPSSCRFGTGCPELYSNSSHWLLLWFQQNQRVNHGSRNEDNLRK